MIGGPWPEIHMGQAAQSHPIGACALMQHEPGIDPFPIGGFFLPVPIDPFPIGGFFLPVPIDPFPIGGFFLPVPIDPFPIGGFFLPVPIDPFPIGGFFLPPPVTRHPPPVIRLARFLSAGTSLTAKMAAAPLWGITRAEVNVFMCYPLECSFRNPRHLKLLPWHWGSPICRGFAGDL